MKNILRNILTLTLCLSFIVQSTVVFANDYEISPEESTKTDFNFIDISDPTHSEYTYVEDGLTYKVIENATDDFSTVHTEIYVQNEDGDFNLFNEFTTVIEVVDDEIHITSDQTGNEETDIIPIDSVIDINQEQIDKDIAMLEMYYMYKGTRANPEISSYIYYGMRTSNTRITNYSLTVIYGTLAAAIGSVSGVGAGLVAGALATVAAKIIDERYPIVYHENDIYHKYLVIGGKIQYGAISWIKVETRIYSDSARRNYIGSAFGEQFNANPWS